MEKLDSNSRVDSKDVISPKESTAVKEDQTEYDYIIRFISRVYIMLFKDKTMLKCSW